MRNVKIFPYNLGSEGANALAKGLGVLRIKKDGNFVLRNGTTIINWGNSVMQQFKQSKRFTGRLTVLNHPDCVLDAINKVVALKCLGENGVSIPQYALTKAEANAFLNDNGIVVCRTRINAKGGAGIVLARTQEELVDAPLYTKHIRHKHEYRVHVVGNRVIDFAQKKKRVGTEPDVLVRSHGDWIFARDGVELPDDCATQACNAVRALGLDFGAVDIGFRVKEGKAFVFEVNTAPGFEIGSSTQASYVKAFQELIGV